MDSLSELSGQLMGLWLVIVGIAVAFGVLYAVGNSLRHWKRHQKRADRGERVGYETQSGLSVRGGDLSEEPDQVVGLRVSGVALRMVISTRSSDQFGSRPNAGLAVEHGQSGLRNRGIDRVRQLLRGLPISPDGFRLVNGAY